MGCIPVAAHSSLPRYSLFMVDARMLLDTGVRPSGNVWRDQQRNPTQAVARRDDRLLREVCKRPSTWWCTRDSIKGSASTLDGPRECPVSEVTSEDRQRSLKPSARRGASEEKLLGDVLKAKSFECARSPLLHSITEGAAAGTHKSGCAP